MFRPAILPAAVLVGIAATSSGCLEAQETTPSVVVVSRDASFAERLAAQETRRYVYVTAGELLPITADLPAEGAIVVGCKCRPAVKGLLTDAHLKATVEGLAAEHYLLRSIKHNGRQVVLVAGGDPLGALCGAYRLAEHLGVRFYMHGDVVPDRPAKPKLDDLDEQGKPLFDRRGIQPFHDFPEGPDWWDVDGYKAVLGQLPKMRMNFFGLHTYPEGGVGPEPLTWIGTAGDVNPDGTVKFSYRSRHFTTANPTGAWGYRPMKTGDYTFGAAAMYDRDDYAPEYMRISGPWNQMSPEQCDALFNRMGCLVDEAFTFARRLGIKTCLGTETPLTIPAPVKERLKQAGKDPADPAVVQEVYQGMFRRIMNTHPLDYYWFWTPEGWTWRDTKQEQIDATLADFRAAIAAAEKVDAPFTLATCGWVLGPAQDRSLFDNVLPKQMPMSCINRQVGHDPVEPGFADVEGRPQWAIPWLEDDPAMISPQLWVGRMRKDAADALSYGCTGLMGIHWRTRVLGPNVSALAKAAWDQSTFNPAVNPELKVTLPKPPEGPDGGQYAHFPNNPIEDTDDDPLYQHVRYDVSAYHLDVPNGTYRVTLKLCEPHYKEKGRRVFGATVQGKQVFDRLDLFAKVGQNRAIDYVAEHVEVTDGRLVIDLVHQVEFPCVAAIAVEGPVTRKINCGGQAWRDYQADWPPSERRRGRDRFLSAADFYADWARSQFGPEAAQPIAELFNEIDGFLPRPSNWVRGPGGINPDPKPWEEVGKEYAFVDQLAAIRPQVQGAGNLERFDFWLNQFRYMRSNAQVNCTWARFNEAIDKVKAEKDPGKQKRLAQELALPVRRELVSQVADVHRHLLASVTTTGLMGNVTNWQQHIMPGLLTEPGEELAKILGEPLPPDCMPSKEYQGRPRLFVPTVRTCLVEGEPLRLTAIVLGAAPSRVAVYWRPLGTGEFARVAMEHAARGVFRVTLPTEAARADLEYYVQAEILGRGANSDVEAVAAPAGLKFPATAPKLAQTVVVVPADE
jgi:hypothetical protein